MTGPWYPPSGLGGTSNYELNVSRGLINGQAGIHVFGEREDVDQKVDGEDVWRGTAAIIPTPPPVGEQMSLVSTSGLDAVAGGGVEQVKINYLDGSGVEQTETVVMTGATPVDTIATDISFVNNMHSISGANTVAIGDITIYKFGAAATVYNVIYRGGNMTLTCKYKVPAAKKLYISNWYGTQTDNKPTTLRLRSTDKDGVLYPDIFIFKGIMFLDSGALPLPFHPYIEIPSLSQVKVSAWATNTLGNVSSGFSGILVDDANP
ncbi:MAG: hypothetical protein ACTSX2_01290 [Candidatus Thorarchaeota archaeon]